MTVADVDTGFRREISRLDAASLVAGSMIGSGIFIVSADILRQVHHPGLMLLVWVIAGIVTVFGALSYGELASMFPRAGGQYVYLQEGISPLFAYLYGWTLFTVIQTGSIAAVAVAFARFTSELIPAVSPDLLAGFTLHLPSGAIEVGVSGQRLLAIAVVILLTAINIRGVRTAAALQTGLTLVKVASLVGLILLGLTIGRNVAATGINFGADFWPAAGLTSGLLPVIGAAMVGALFSMDAWNGVGFAAGELKNPARDVPFSMTMGVLLVTGLYLLANLAYLSVLPADAIANAPQDRVGTAVLFAMLGKAGLIAMTIAVMISTFGCVNGMILTSARVYYAMARDRLFFSAAARLHPRHRTPHVALIVQAVWSCALCLSGTYGQLLDYVIFAALLFYVLTVIGLFILRRRKPDAPRPMKVPGYPWIPAAYVILTALIAIDLLIEKPLYTWPGLVIVAAGVPVYYLWKVWGRAVPGAMRPSARDTV